MTLSEFLIKYNGKYCEVAGTSDALNQCCDLANAYLRDVLGQPIVEWTNAVDFPSKLTDKFDFILNTPTNVPTEGDLVIWQGNEYGHIGIFLEGDANHFHSFDQNWPQGSYCTPVEHLNYNNVKGWLRLKPQLEGLAIQVGYNPTFEGQDVMVNGVHYKAIKVDNKLVWKIESVVVVPPVVEPPSEPQPNHSDSLIQKIKDILFGKGYIWDKIRKLKELLK